jgi:hypothetical protein
LIVDPWFQDTRTIIARSCFGRKVNPLLDRLNFVALKMENPGDICIAGGPIMTDLP